VEEYPRWKEQGLLEIRQGILVFFPPRGMTPVEMKDLIESGWMYVGVQAFRFGGVIEVPGKPPGGLAEGYVWMRPEPMMPQRAVFENFVGLYDADRSAAPVLDKLCRVMFNVGIERLASVVMQHAEVQDGEETEDQHQEVERG